MRITRIMSSNIVLFIVNNNIINDIIEQLCPQASQLTCYQSIYTKLERRCWLTFSSNQNIMAYYLCVILKNAFKLRGNFYYKIFLLTLVMADTLWDNLAVTIKGCNLVSHLF